MAEARVNFDALLGGAVYDVVARITGYGPAYYRRAAMAVPVRPGMTLLEAGCGTASLSLALAERMRGRGRIVGVDVAERQLEQARRKVGAASVPIELRRGSIAQLPLEDSSIDGICVSQVLHSLPQDVLERGLAESARVLVPGGFLGLIEWSRPRIGLSAALWTPSLLGMRRSHNWLGTYPELFERHGLDLATDVYLDSLNRCQVFVKRRY